MGSLDDLIAALDSEDTASTTTSLRHPVALRRALQIAVQLGMAPTANDATVQSLRGMLEAFALQQALEEHFEAHPGARPTLAEETRALARLDSSPVAERMDLIERAVAEVQRHRPGAHADDVLLWSLSLLEREHSVSA